MKFLSGSLLASVFQLPGPNIHPSTAPTATSMMQSDTKDARLLRAKICRKVLQTQTPNW